MLTGLFALAIGCSSASSRVKAETVSQQLPRPPVVIVYDLAISRDEVTEKQPLFQDLLEDPNGYGAPTPEQRRLGEEAAQAFATELVQGLLKLGMSTERARKGTRNPRNALIIHGAFLDVIEGMRLQHIIVGVSPAEKRLDVRVHVHQMSPEGNIALLEFLTHADRNDIVVDSTDAGAPRSVTEQMAVWCAKQALASLSDLFAKNDWIP